MRHVVGGRSGLTESPTPALSCHSRAAAHAQGLEKYGVGGWRDIRSALLPDVRSACLPQRMVFASRHSHFCAENKSQPSSDCHTLYVHVNLQWDETALRVKASRLFGSQSLARYAGWKVPRGAVEAEYARNKRIGDRTGCWKAGVLVEDDHGTVAKALEEEADLGGPSGAAAGGHAQAGDEAAGAAPAAKKARGAKKA